MANRKLTVVAQFRARAGMEETLKQELLALIEPTRQEPGCINYDLHQKQDEPAGFLFHENWESKDHLDKHLESSHVKAALGKVPDLVAEPVKIELFDQIG